MFCKNKYSIRDSKNIEGKKRGHVDKTVDKTRGKRWKK
jgi:hypothetical protein